MSVGLVLSLGGLALIDSTSIGTLFIPIWLLLAPGRVKVGRILLYLGTIAVFYFGVGLLISLGAGAAITAFGEAMKTKAVLWGQLVLGVGLFVLSFRFDPKRRKGNGGAIQRWRERAMSEQTSVRWLMALALLAGLTEVATMLPYLGAIGLMTTSGLSALAILTLLAGYCVVMIVPAGVLLAARMTARSMVEPVLQRLNNWIMRNGASATGWLLAIAGFLVARDAAVRLFWPHLM
ncbi:GAP family protein [Kibdelosporangium aridum]|uniref:Sap, sulfolipid-1-addressing protein n=1 Tax=Kibdelosporangium aridum TaxID=2030 RepID=A0A1W2FGK1_KIBAR|nr:GAP family protein [Kibdelosporangium aridum]SMD20806.1 Sap, sulfolipid-1-addressing protein [Kibdelosporangium aridum]